MKNIALFFMDFCLTLILIQLFYKSNIFYSISKIFYMRLRRDKYRFISYFFRPSHIGFSILFLIILFNSQNIYAQKKIHFGLEGGTNFMFVSANNTPWILAKQPPLWGFSGGGYFEIEFGKRWYARIELLAHAKRIDVSGISKENDSTNLQIKTKFTQISAPLEVGFQCLPLDSPVKLSIFAGISPNFSQSAGSPNCTIGTQNASFAFANVSLGLEAGLCFQFNIVSILARYEYMATPTFKVDSYKFKHNGLSLLLRFNLF